MVFARPAPNRPVGSLDAATAVRRTRDLGVTVDRLLADAFIDAGGQIGQFKVATISRSNANFPVMTNRLKEGSEK